jgi:NADPH:quinone reductase-like Zn-dependent oxidoreductase
VTYFAIVAMVLNASKEVDVIIGCDYAGIVEEIGLEVPEGTRKIGERVAGFVFGGLDSCQGTALKRSSS